MALYRLCVAVCCLLMAQASKIVDVQDLNYEPKVAIQCGKIPKHVDTNTGQWLDDVKQKQFCTNDTKKILKHCKKTYPNIDVTNIVEDNNQVTLCDDSNCESNFTVTPYRCLVGQFEADALTYPPDAQCNFGYIHETETCKGHDYWRDRANAVCVDKEKKLEKYGILVPCGTDKFTGVEYVCCQKAKTPMEMFADHVKKFSHHIPAVSKGCNRRKYELKLQKLRKEKDDKVKTLAKQLMEAKERMQALNQDDPQQAQAFYKNTLKALQNTIKNIEEQAGLDESQVHQERRECIQIETNHKKHAAMKSFVDALKKHADKPGKILKAFKNFMRVLNIDHAQNARFLSRLLHSKSAIAKSARKVFGPHIDLLKSTLKEGVELLKYVKSVRQRKIDLEPPFWARDVIDFDWAHETPPPPQTGESTGVDPTDASILRSKNEHPEDRDHSPAADATKRRPTSPTSTLPPENEHQKYGDHPLKSRAVFAAVIGLSCGALVIMVVIVLALFFRKGSSKRPTKTVIAETESPENRHLLKMQEDGFENPTYKFFVH